MNFKNISRLEFEYRIFVSLSIVICICLLSFIFFPNSDSIAVRIGEIFNIENLVSSKIYFLLLSLTMVAVSLLRMWGGSVLSSRVVMSFKVQNQSLLLDGPYLLVRNPIYLADFIAIFSCALCLPPIGLFMPILFYFHYAQLIRYEETSFSKKFPNEIDSYYKTVPRLFPSIKSTTLFLRKNKNFRINYDGFRHNDLYLLFIPGFIVAAITNSFMLAIIIGLPGILDWAIIHTKIGYKKETGSNRKKVKKVFNDILYSQCWEDPRIDRKAFEISEDDTIFSITSGGCNVLAFLIDNPQKILSLDISPYQNYLLELKIKLFQNLPYEKILEFVGVRNSNDRIEIYMKNLRDGLSINCRKYWDQNFDKIKMGIIHCGRYEKYLRLIRILVSAAIGNKLILNLFQEKDQSRRVELFDKKIKNIRWKIVTKFILSRRIMSLLFDKDFFKYLDESFAFGKHFSEKAKHAFTELPMRENYFLSYILLGRYYNEDCLPVFLQRENYELIKSRVDRIEIITDNCERYFATLNEDTIDNFNMSNVFEWMSESEFQNLLNEIRRIAKNSAILTYRNLLVKRKSPEIMRGFISPKIELSKTLHKKDLSFIYNNFVVEKIIKQ